jgi:acyl-coenzyme A thioesterase PaaI-like protein
MDWFGWPPHYAANVKEGDRSPSIQEQFFPGLMCFGCGPANTKGLRLRSFPMASGTTADFLPWPEHDNGLGFLNGGIICTVLDCHSATPVLLAAQRMGLTSDSVPLPFVTAGLDVSYLRPTPLALMCRLHAEVTSTGDSMMEVKVELESEGKVRAVAHATWKRWNPR